MRPLGVLALLCTCATTPPVTTPAEAVPGTRVVVHDELPTPLRLRLPPDGRRLGLVVWLHPTGATLNAEVERLAPHLFERGYALAVPIAPRLDGWNDGELVSLLDRSVPALTEVDGSNTVLWGFSAGAQAALVAWAVHPRRYTRVIAVGPAPDLLGHAAPAIGASPLRVLVGDEEPTVHAWRALVDDWTKRGLDARLDVVPRRGHGPLFDVDTPWDDAGVTSSR